MRKTIAALFLVFILAFMLRFSLQFDHTVLIPDETRYSILARSNNITFGLDQESRPLFMAFLKGALFFQNSDFAMKMLSVIFGSLLIFPTFLLGKKVFDKKIGLIAASLVAIIPIMISYSTYIMTEIPFTFFLMVSMLFFVNYSEQDRKNHLLLSILFIILAFLIRQEAAIIASAYFIFLITRHMKRSFILSFLLIAAMVFLIAFFAARHELSIMEDVNDASHSDWEKKTNSIGTIEGASHENISFIFVIEKFLLYSGISLWYLFGIFGFSLAIIFVFFIYSRKSNKEIHSFLLLLFLSLFMFYSFTITRDRRFIPLIPIMSLYLAVGIHKIGEIVYGNSKLLRKFAIPLFIFLAFGLAVASLYIGPNAVKANNPVYIADTSNWIKANIPNSVISAYDGRYLYYSGKEFNKTFFTFPYAPYNETISYFHKHGVTHIILDKAWIDRQPEFKPVFYGKDVPELGLVYRDYPTGTAIYQIK